MNKINCDAISAQRLNEDNFDNMYSITITASALKELDRIQKADIKKIGKAINGLAVDPRPLGVKKLKGGSEDLYRIRSGHYRIIYSIEDEIKVVDVRKIGHRKDVYKLL